VNAVSWNDCREFIRRLNARLSGGRVSLPSEAEWECACRAGSTGRWCFGDGEADLDAYAWYEANARDAPQPVGTKTPNAWALHDMHGNVWEWCHDWYNDNYYQNSPKQDPPGSPTGSARVQRGGAWDYGPRRAAHRGGPHEPTRRRVDVGFRVVLVASAPGGGHP
jgi:formylglycine-generating enzyme required for sulfatase activity